jgi:hypothetical protein
MGDPGRPGDIRMMGLNKLIGYAIIAAALCAAVMVTLMAIAERVL